MALLTLSQLWRQQIEQHHVLETAWQRAEM